MKHTITITVAHKGQVDKVLAVLGEAEVEGTLPFSFTTKVEYEEPIDEPVELTELEETG